ncbi:ROK family protein (plasmid) [Arthrobacter agilis]|uniref:ROK family protein n=1 Tax=Arthrobacter agilis TaxID=37921 RepID=UPI0023672839|nr:ROK family protein [Arthrobacter agilis]WDF35276.1 ROK family protein [Arthrobacter agilis]
MEVLGELEYGVEQLGGLLALLQGVRSGRASTRPELVEYSGLGRNVVAQRVVALQQAGLLREGNLARSSGGRAPRRITFCADAGIILTAELGATSLAVAVSDLAGNLNDIHVEDADITDGPEIALDRVQHLFTEMLSTQKGDVSVWGVGIGLPGPVEFATARPVVPPIMPGWNGFDVRAYLSSRFEAPVWVDNDANLIALGELRGGLAQNDLDFICLKIGSGIGAGLVSQGRLHRGAQGSAGDIGHIVISGSSNVVCRCGKRGCLEALAGGTAIGRRGEQVARAGHSALLAAKLRSTGSVSAEDVADAANRGDALARDLLQESAAMVGEAISSLVNLFNPSLVLLGGGVIGAGDLYLAQIRTTILERSLPLATRSLRILPSMNSDHAGLRGAAFMILDQLFSPALFQYWFPYETPAGHPNLTERGSRGQAA